MAKLTILSPFDQIAQPLESARTQNCDKSISYGFWGHLSRPLFQTQKFLIFHSTLATMTMIPFKRVPQYSKFFKLPS